jgi:hypothetical protein
MHDNDSNGKTLWDLIARSPIVFLLIFLLIMATTVSLVVWMTNKKIGIQTPWFSTQQPPPEISQDTSNKSKTKIDTTAIINQNTHPKNPKVSSIIIKQPNKDTVKTQVVTVTSNNQLGGITANQVNIGSQPRKLDISTANQLVNYIPNKDEKIDLTCIMGDAESFQFATQIKDFLLSIGYKNVNGVSQALFNQPVKGQFMDRDSSGVKIVIGSLLNKTN